MKLLPPLLTFVFFFVSFETQAAPPKRVVSSTNITLEEHKAFMDKQRAKREKAMKNRTPSRFKSDKSEVITNKDGTKTIRNKLRKKNGSRSKSSRDVWSNLNQ